MKKLPASLHPSNRGKAISPELTLALQLVEYGLRTGALDHYYHQRKRAHRSDTSYYRICIKAKQSPSCEAKHCIGGWLFVLLDYACLAKDAALVDTFLGGPHGGGRTVLDYMLMEKNRDGYHALLGLASLFHANLDEADPRKGAAAIRRYLTGSDEPWGAWPDRADWIPRNVIYVG